MCWLRKLLLPGLLIVSMVLPVSSALAVPQTSPSLANALDDGRALMGKGRYQVAIKRLKKAERLASEAPARLLLDLSTCLNATGDFLAAEGYARRGLEASAEAAEEASAYNQLGISLFSQVLSSFPRGMALGEDRSGRLGEAESAFKQVLVLTDASIAWYNLGEVLKFSGRSREARAAFSEYLERSPDGARAAEAGRAMDWFACVEAVSAEGGSSEEEPVTVGGDVVAPVKIHAAAPGYTERARQARVTGTMIFAAIIDKGGDVRCVDVLKGLPLGLSETTAQTVKRWKFEPATLYGEPVVVFHHLSVTMSLSP